MNQQNRHDRSLLTLCGLSLVLSCLASAEARADEDADLQAVREYRLTDERVEEFTQASRNLVNAMEADPGLAADDSSLDFGSDASIAEIAAGLDAQPAAREAIESAGMTSAEYVTFSFAMVQAGMGAWLVKEQGPDALPADVPRENVDYYIANSERFEALAAEMEAMQDDGE